MLHVATEISKSMKLTQRSCYMSTADLVYSDIGVGVVETLHGKEAINAQIDNVLGITPYQVPGRPAFSSSLYQFLHEPNDSITRASVEAVVEQILTNNVTRVDIEDVTCVEIEHGIILIDIEYRYNQEQISSRFAIGGN